MKYHISNEQHFFFEQNHYIEFEELLSSEEQQKLLEGIEKVGKSERNLSFESDIVKSIVHKPRLARLAAEIARTKRLRFGFDQLIEPGKGFPSTNYCIQGLVCLLYLCLEGSHAIYTLPEVASSDLPLDPQKRYLLIGWAKEKALYVFQPEDNHTHDLKKKGYVFGDRLKQQWHPILTR